jgi:hypothetical protein
VIVKERLLFLLDSVLVWAVQSSKDKKLTVKGSLTSDQYTIIELPDPMPIGKVHFSDCFGVINCIKGRSIPVNIPKEGQQGTVCVCVCVCGGSGGGLGRALMFVFVYPRLTPTLITVLP